MTDDDRYAQLLRSALPQAPGQGPSRDLWPLVVDRLQAPPRWSWFDLSVAVTVLVVLWMFPDWLWLLAYQL
jgi:hypothetical protein